jgi:transposase-like protein
MFDLWTIQAAACSRNFRPVVDLYLSETRDLAAAKAFFRSATRRPPAVIVSRFSVSERKPMPRCSSVPTISIR